MGFFSKKPSDLAEAIADAFNYAPKQWSHSYGQVSHKGGIVVHVGGGRRHFHLSATGGAEIYDLSGADRKLIWAAYQSYLNDHLYSLVAQ